MKISFHHRRDALSLIDVTIIIVTLALAACFFLVFFPRKRISKRADRITCVNNLKQIGLSFRIYAGDNRERYPMNISTNDKPVVNEATQVYEYFQQIEYELGTPKVVVCPKDTNRIAAKNFTNFNNGNVSYFIGLDGNENLENSMIAGDRNISNGFPPKDNILRLTAKQKVSFTKEIHIDQGDIALGDGSVQQVTSKQLRSSILPNTGFLTNRIKLP